jgi:hypothetical protein
MAGRVVTTVASTRFPLDNLPQALESAGVAIGAMNGSFTMFDAP